MSTRTSLSVATPSGYAEQGTDLTALENADPTNGNRFSIDRRTQLYGENTSGASKTLTFTWSYRGVDVTRVVTLAAGAKRLMGPFDLEMTQHEGDLADLGQVWVTANGSAGDVKLRVVQNIAPI